MKAQLQKFARKVDVLSLRERVIMFATVAAILLFLVNFLLIDPQFVKQKKLAGQIAQDQAKMLEIQTLIEQKVRMNAIDPDAENRLRLQQLNKQQGQLQESLLEMHKGLISPEKMTDLLEDILKRHGKLRLMSLKTLPVASLNDGLAIQAANAAGQPAINEKNMSDTPANSDVIYKHGVEITLQGSYLDMLSYMAELEAMPWQLFWGQVRMEVDEYPKATFSLTLFTLSLDKKWLNL